jgi:hypothetical protein
MKLSLRYSIAEGSGTVQKVDGEGRMTL